MSYHAHFKHLPKNRGLQNKLAIESIVGLEEEWNEGERVYYIQVVKVLVQFPFIVDSLVDSTDDCTEADKIGQLGQ